MSGFSRNPDYGQGEHSISEAEQEQLAGSESLALKLMAVFSSPSYKPPLLPAVALEVHELAQDPDVEVSRLVLLLRKDSFLAGQVLKRAQSSLYAPAGASVPSLQTAVTRLGLKPLRDLVWETALGGRVFRSKEYAPQMEELQRHSTATAYFARLVSLQTSIPAEYAFLGGLMHDIGAAATLLVAAEHIKPTPDFKLLMATVRASHAETSAQVAKLWKLPADLELALGYHHTLTVGGVTHPVCAIIALAEMFAVKYGAGVQHLDMAPTQGQLKNACEALGFTEASLKSVAAEAHKLAKGLSLVA